MRCSKCGNQWFAMQSDIRDEHGVAFAAPLPERKAEPRMEVEDASPPRRLQPIPREYTSDIGMPLGDEFPMQAPEPRYTAPAEETPATPQEPEEEIDIDALEQAIALKQASLPSMAPRSYAPHIAMMAMACVIFLLLNLFTAFLFFRDTITAAIPATRALYSMVGFQPTQGLSLADLKLKRYDNANNPNYPRFDIAGTIVNTQDLAIQEPDVWIAMVGKNGEILREWMMNGGEKRVPKDRPLTFSTQNEYLKTSRVAEAESLVLHLGSPVELSLSDE